MNDSQTNNSWETKENLDGSVTITKYVNKVSVGNSIELEIPSTIDGKTVTAIGENAIDNRSIASIIIPNSISCIEDYAFYCPCLQNVKIPDSVKIVGVGAFMGCGSLETVCFPNGVETIGDSVFEDVEFLKKVILPRSVKSIGEFVFEKRVTIYAPSDSYAHEYAITHKIRFSEISDEMFIIKNNSIKEYLGNSSVVNVPVGIISVGSHAFSENEFLHEVILPDGIKTIGKYAFDGCSNLETINLPDSISQINESAFFGCGNLVAVSLSKGIKTISKYVFRGCYNLARCIIPQSISHIEDMAFSYCENLEGIIIPNSVVTIGVEAFFGCTKLSNISVPDSVINIGYGAFSRCNKLKDDSLNSLPFLMPGGQYEFWYCNNQKMITIPDGVSSIDRGAFDDCISLECIMIPSSVTSISNRAFEKCINLQIIIGESGSFVEKWSRENGIKFTTDPADNTLPRPTLIPGSIKQLETQWKFKKNEDGTRAIEIYIGQDLHPIIPSMAGKTKVTKILGDAFIHTYRRTEWFRDINIESAVISEGITSIERNAFYRCSNLKSVIIPSSVLYIGKRAFAECHQLSDVQIPESVTNIDNEAFKGCEGLADEQGFIVVNGILFDYIGTNLDVVIPSSVTKISYGAIKSNPNIKNVVIPHGVTYIGAANFTECCGLESITVPETVEFMCLMEFDIGKKAKIYGKVGSSGYINEHR